MPLIDPTRDVPGYAEARARQDLVRDAAFLGLPETLCGLIVAPMTFRHLLWLQLIQSPFLGFAPFPPDEQALKVALAGFFKTLAPVSPPPFMWRPNIKTLNPQPTTLNHFLKCVGKLKVPAAVAGISDFVSETFMDAPASAGGESVSYFSVGAALTHRLCGRYPGLDPNPQHYPAAIDLPLKVGFQLLKCLKREENPKAILFNGLTDQAVARWQQTLNPEPGTLN